MRGKCRKLLRDRRATRGRIIDPVQVIATNGQSNGEWDVERGGKEADEREAKKAFRSVEIRARQNESSAQSAHSGDVKSSEKWQTNQKRNETDEEK